MVLSKVLQQYEEGCINIAEFLTAVLAFHNAAQEANPHACACCGSDLSKRLPPEKETYHDYGINWIWYLDVTLDKASMTATIHKHYRLHKGEGKHPMSKSTFRLNEGPSRIVESVLIDGLTYCLTNPRHVFDYN